MGTELGTTEIIGKASSKQDDSRHVDMPQAPTPQGSGAQTEARGPWTPDEEEAIAILMDLLPLLAAANEAVKRGRHQKNDPL